jgi:hypothetical protein
MRIKVIQHAQMQNSINYLYRKSEGELASIMPGFSPCNTLDVFNSHIDIIKNDLENDNDSAQRNNLIKHFVVTFSPQDKGRFEEKKEEILKDILNKIGISDPENYGLTAFFHEDKNHPHIHVVFSRVGLNGEKFKDNNIGWRLNDIAKEIEKKYNLVQATKEPFRIKITNKHLYRPTKRGELLKLIDYSTKHSRTITEFKEIMSRHGIFVKENEKDNTFTYINNKDHIAYEDKLLPKGARKEGVYMNIKTNKLTSSEQKQQSDLKTLISKCNTLQELKNLFPESKITYTKDGNNLYNIKIQTPDRVYALHEFGLAHLGFEGNSMNSEAPLNYTGINEDREYQIKRDEKIEDAQLDARARKKGKRLGIRHNY